jgi:Peptidase_C39 like family
MRLKLTGASAAIAALVAVPLVAGCSSANAHNTSSDAAKAAPAAAAKVAAVSAASPGGATKPADMNSLTQQSGMQANVASQAGTTNLPLSASASASASGTTPAVAAKAKAKTRTVWLKIKAQPQQKSDWCVLAASRAMLSHRYKKIPSQTTLGKYMKTRQNKQHWGTNWANVVPGLKDFTHHYTYTWAHFTTARAYFNGMAYETDKKNTPTVGAFYFQRLPWRNMGGQLSGHAVVVTGYYYNWKTQAGSLHFWDPWQNTGYHAANPFTAFADAKSYGGNGAYTVGLYG